MEHRELLFLVSTAVSFQFLDSAEGSQKKVDCLALASKFLDELSSTVLPGISRREVNEGELRSFVAFAVSFPNGFLTLIDTYDVIK